MKVIIGTLVRENERGRERKKREKKMKNKRKKKGKKETGKRNRRVPNVLSSRITFALITQNVLKESDF